MHHDKALIITPTLFCEADYKADWEQPMRRIIDDWGLRYPGVKQVEHVFFYGAAVADPEQIQDYLRRARRLGRDFAAPPLTPSRAGAGAQEGGSDHAG
jgi:NAD(P)H dehydrogenase (quinone)